MVNEMEDAYFSEREGQVLPAHETQIGSIFWGGFVTLVEQRLRSGAFAESFPICCSDTGLPCDSDSEGLGRLFKAEIKSIDWPLNSTSTPNTSDLLNAIEFFWRHVSQVFAHSGHSSPSWGFQHHHYISFDRSLGRKEYKNDVNRLLRRCAHPYLLDELGKAKRRLLPLVQAVIRATQFRTSDSELDRLLCEACEKFESPDLVTQREALKRLWDAWERLKSLLLPSDKAESTKKLLDEFVQEAQLREKVEEDARALTWIGNNLMIRHTEVNRPPIPKSEHVDYLSLRLLALVSSILKSRGWIVSF